MYLNLTSETRLTIRYVDPKLTQESQWETPKLILGHIYHIGFKPFSHIIHGIYIHCRGTEFPPINLS